MTHLDPTFWGLLSLAITVAQYIPYIRGILSGRVRPHVFSWLVWALPGAITFFAQMSKGAGPGAWATGFTTLMCFVVLFLSLSRGEKKIVLIDWIALFCAMAAIAVWAVTDDPLGAVVLSVVANFLGFVPTVRKSFLKPREELLTSYIISGFKWVCSMAALQSVTLTTLLFPLTSVMMSVAFIAYMLMRRSRLKAAV